MYEASKIKILLVDDRPENLLTLEAIIDNEEYQLVKALSGEEALKYLLTDDFAAILLDVQMPGMDGFETAKIIKAREKTKNIPILFITANNLESEHIFMGYSVGALDYILKPIDPMILKSKVEGFVELYKMKQKLIQQANELAEKNKVIEHIAYHDGLTELPNRRFFQDQLIAILTEARLHNQMVVVTYLNLDRFKYVNDSLGHIIGDRLLQKVAKRLKETVRATDIIARVAGDEFALILPDTDREQALELIEKILQAFKEPFVIDKYELYITCCIGLSVFPFDGEDPVSLLMNADAALHRAKEQGKNKYHVFHSGLNIYSYRSFLLEKDLRKAVEKEQLILAYQPVVDHNLQTVKKAVVVLQWNHPEWGVISPKEFLPIAEETGIIVEIGHWQFQRVCQQLRAWIEKGIEPVPIIIKLSAQQLLQKNLFKSINSQIELFNINPKLLEIELNESTIFGQGENIIQSIEKLRALGVGVSLEKFGTGYSSLTLLRNIPLKTINIDPSLVSDIGEDSYDSEAIIKAIMVLGNSLNISVVADGVENHEQLDVLRKYDIQGVRGSICSPPLLPDDFEKFMLSNTYLSEEPVKETESREMNSPVSTFHLSDDENDLRTEKLESALDLIRSSYSISSREMDVFRLVISGLTNKEISEKLFISEHTVKNHITRILQKLNVTDRVQVIALVYETFIQDGKNL